MPPGHRQLLCPERLVVVVWYLPFDQIEATASNLRKKGYVIVETRLGRRTALTFPLVAPPQKN